MKKITILFVLFISFISCETVDVSNSQNNYVLNTELEDLLKEIQLDFPKLIEVTGRISGKLIRQEYLHADLYSESLHHTFNTEIWNLAYTNLLPKMDEAIQIAEIEGAYNHLGVIKTLKAFTLITLIDKYGDIPYSEIDLPNPNLDTGESVYDIAFLILNGALLDFGVQGADLETDYYYNNDFSKWIKLANTLKMNIYSSTRLIDASAINNFEIIASSGNYISTIEDDFEFKYVNSEMIHPSYAIDYSEVGGGRYRSNWLMDKIVNTNDPRRRYYFYRQKDCTPGNIGVDGSSCSPSPIELSCSLEDSPSHYSANMVFCNVADGYWGRDHGNSGGIPPDGFSRSVTGIYPAAGKFDGNEFDSVSPGIGGQGLGITPILLSSWVDFMRAEMALVNNDNGAASLLMLTGIQRSITKVQSFISLDTDADTTYAPTSADVSNYINSISDSFDNADNLEKWNVLAEQQLIATYGNGHNSYNFYRRTGFPTSLQFHLNENSGPFVRSFLYPQEIVDANSNIDQKPNAEVRVFWDNNPTYPEFPFAN